ncbi:hypothetical protein [Paludisphaera borealis]|uniref:Uncharacterized protein n=1 Tax=Paludisphaera borealis TaxID=1387353 RepID=A0A1U7CKB5_9BACT|nr:hypothetical protein [Paludisphaera borealis]APW59375.1 hypothetical protein BSF38_00798 [Paludisphaera borealis]
MPDAEPNDPTAVEQQTYPCRNLRHQGMYVFTDGRGRDPDKDYDNTIFWCLKTMKGYGPDDESVGIHDCRNPARSCHEPL